MTSAIRLGSRGDSYYEYLLCVPCFCLLHGICIDGFPQEAVHSNSAFLYSQLLNSNSFLINVRIEQRAFIVRQVETRHNLFISPNCFYRCMKTQFKRFMTTSYRRVFKRDSLTRQNSFLSATLKVKCRFRFFGHFAQ